MRNALFLSALIGLGCLNPDEILTVRGAVRSDAPEGQRIELLRDRRTADYGACLGLVPFMETTTDAKGEFVFEVFRAQAQSLTGVGAYCFRVQATMASGAEASIELPAITSQLTLPTLPDWHANPRRSDAGVIDFDPVQETPDASSARVVHRLELRTFDGGLAWRSDDLVLEPGATQPRRVALSDDPRLLQEFPALLTVQARVLPVEAPALEPLGPTPQATLRAHGVGALETYGTWLPWTYLASCDAVGVPCPLTDRRLQPVELDGESQVTLVLGAEMVPSVVVLRGFVSPAKSVVITLTERTGVAHVSTHPLGSSMFSDDQELETRALADGGHVSRLRPEPRFAAIPLSVNDWVTAITVAFPGGVERISEISVY